MSDFKRMRAVFDTTDQKIKVDTNTKIVTKGLGVNDYNLLINHPSIEEVELIGNRTFEDLGLERITNSELEALLTL